MPQPREAIEIAAFGFSGLAYAAAAVVLASNEALRPFASDLNILLAASAVSSLAALFLDNLRAFIVVHVLRTLLLFMAAATLGGRDSTLEILFLLPWLAETALYFRTWLAAAQGLAATAGLLTLDAVQGGPDLPWLVHSAPVAVTATVVLGAGVLLTYYRNQVVRERVTVERLNRDVDQLIGANRAFQDYADSIESVTEENERNRITRELHDVIGYSLTNLVMMMNAGKVLSRDHPEKLDELFLQARGHADEALQESRKILYTLRAIPPASRKGINAIHHLAQSFQAATDIRVIVSSGNLPQSLGHEIDSALFRLVQEGMTNALRHGQARQVRVRFWRFESEVQVQVWDNGKGAQAVTEGVGLAGMRERFSALGGAVHAGPVADGFQVTATIPLAQEWTIEP